MGLVFFLEGVFHGNVQDFRTKASMATVEKGADVEKRTGRFSKGEPTPGPAYIAFTCIT